ncbi:hypothetical protein BKI52_09490 [marine bacterium AO1-C]|nr:hypothetical protein BKI52_09490 [marine bacterium AO1-C]
MISSFPFEAIWYGVDLGVVRPINATYGGEPLEKLPPIAEEHLDSNFGYLSNTAIRELERGMSEHVAITFKSTNEPDFLAEDAQWKAKIDRVQRSLPDHIQLPGGLVKFMSSSVAQYLIPSCTACYFDLPTKAMPFHWLGENGYIFHFYRDQQDCVFWYYYVRDYGESCILTSAIPFLDEYAEEGELEGLTDDVVKREVFMTATTFEEFIYRTWIENFLWFSMDGEALDPETKKLSDAYLEHYKQTGG